MSEEEISSVNYWNKFKALCCSCCRTKKDVVAHSDREHKHSTSDERAGKDKRRSSSLRNGTVSAASLPISEREKGKFAESDTLRDSQQQSSASGKRIVVSESNLPSEPPQREEDTEDARAMVDPEKAEAARKVAEQMIKRIRDTISERSKSLIEMSKKQE